MPKYNPNPFPKEIRPKRAECFWSYVEIGSPEQCWEWKRYRNQGGYGTYQCGSKKKNSYTASRVAFRLAYGGDPLWAHVLHRCDNRACCNPDHLFLGGVDDNAKDASAKGRTMRGERQKTAKLTAQAVREIRASYIPSRRAPSPYTLRGLAKTYGVDHTLIARIILRKAWAHVE